MANKGINKVILIGNLGQDPEVRYMANGNAVTNLSLATLDTWKNKQTGEIREKTEWHKVVIFGKLAEIAGEYLSKGSQIYIEGSLQTRKWQDQLGQDRYTTEVIVSAHGTMKMLGSRTNSKNKDFNNYKNDINSKKSKIFEKQTEEDQEEKKYSEKIISEISKNDNDINSEDDIPF